MIPKLVNDLYLIASKPGATPATLLIATRRICRTWVSVQEQIYAERHEYLRCSKTLRKRLPYSALDVTLLETHADNHRSAELETARLNLVHYGYALAGDRTVAEALGFDRVCDILNVNPVHRAKARMSNHTLRGLIFEARSEDSADVKSQTRSGGPLCEAFYSAYFDELLQGSLKEMEQQAASQAGGRHDLAQMPVSPTIH
jgi:hypothetical protein